MKSRLILALLALLVSNCGAFEAYSRAKQLRTFADMQVICGRIEMEGRQLGRALSASELRTAVHAVNEGLDAWGNSFELEVRESRGTTDFVLVSRGSDGVLEHSSLADYFLLEARDIHGDSAADIVFRNGEAVTHAGK